MSSTRGERIGLVAGSGRLPLVFADEATRRGLCVFAVGHHGETDPALAGAVASLEWVHLGQVSRIVAKLRASRVERAVLAGGIGRVRALSHFRPDFGALEILAGLRGLRDDGLLRAIAAFFEGRGIAIIAPTDFLSRALAPQGHLAGPALSRAQENDVRLGIEVARALGAADVGQTVVVRKGHVLALEAIEGTDAAIRRGGALGGPGAAVIKLCKPGQDERFDLPAVGLMTLDAMREVGASVLAVESGKTILLDADVMLKRAAGDCISVVGVPGPATLG